MVWDTVWDMLDLDMLDLDLDMLMLPMQELQPPTPSLVMLLHILLSELPTPQMLEYAPTTLELRFLARQIITQSTWSKQLGRFKFVNFNYFP